MNRVAFILPLLAACAPQSATITGGSYTAFLAVSTSQNIFGDTLNLDDFESHIQIDCRDDVDNDQLLPNRLNVCDAVADTEHEGWLGYDGYEIVGGTLDAWRGEAVMTSEGDMLMTFHTHLPGGDFRFAIAVDPQFQPTECLLNDQGQSERTDIDGNWLEAWKAGDGTDSPISGAVDGSMFYLNAGSYQFNPSNTEQLWIIPDDWLAGYGQAKFGDEDMYMRTTRYGTPSAYSAFELDEYVPPERDDLFYVDLDAGQDPTTAPAFGAMVSQLEQIASESVNEMLIPFNEVTAGANEFVPRIETNSWRLGDGQSAGLDGWGELHHNWVRFDQNAADLALGAPASGEFHLVFTAASSQSKLVVNGTFDVPKIKKDRWTVDDLEAETLAASGTTVCGEAPPEE